MDKIYGHAGLTRAEIDALRGALVLEFGAGWCGYCQAAQALIGEALLSHAGDLAYFKIEDGKGKKLGRSFGVKLWPTLIFIRDGLELARLVRPVDSFSVANALSKLEQE